jgi:hypothetical protein
VRFCWLTRGGQADGAWHQGPSTLFGDEEYLIYIPAISKVKIFGVLPKEKRLRAEKNSEVLGVNILAKDLEDLAKEVLGIAK